MIWLLAACVLWGPSFGLVPILLRDYGMDSTTLSVLRMAYSLVLFLPLLRPRKFTRSCRLALTALGGLQYGVMYLTLFASYHFLQGYEVALLTIFTPLYVGLLDPVFARRFPGWKPLLCITLAVWGAGVIRYANPVSEQFWTGFWILQVCNLSFALGQVGYRHLMHTTRRLQDCHAFGWMYLGALLVCLTGWGIWAEPAAALRHLQTLPLRAWAIVLWLGLIPSGLAFFLFNHGALRVDPTRLAIANNLKIPIALVMALGLFGQGDGMDPARFTVGTLILLGALWWNEKPART
jgi:drug/metabolite transporter (DMT)-like permease